MFDRINLWLARRRTIYALSRLSERNLRDLGVGPRSNIRTYVYGNFR